MTIWDVLNNIINVLPPIVAIFLVLAAGVIFLTGFSRHGMNFIRYGFKQMALDPSLEQRFDALDKKIDGLRTEIDGLQTELNTIKVNHFGHLKSYLGILNGILLDKGIIDNQTRARLDNELRDM